MRKRVKLVHGVPVDLVPLSEEGEQERARLSKLARKEYEDTGTLTSEKLLEANTEFLDNAQRHKEERENGDNCC